MVESRLKSIIPEVNISLQKQNENARFAIKLAQAPSLKYQILFTDGLSEKEQPVKDGFEAYKKIELYFLLPDYFDLKKNDWPLFWLEKLAELPQKNDTWFGPGDTIPAGNPPQILFDNFPANHFMLVDPIDARLILTDDVWETAGIRFLGVLPICQEELDYKIRNSATVLLARLKRKGHTEKVDFFRPSVCRKRIFGF